MHKLQDGTIQPTSTGGIALFQLKKPHPGFIFQLMFLLIACPVIAQSTSSTIAEARDLPVGSTVTVEGRVTVPSGLFSSAMFDQGFQIQDQTAGIYVSVATDPGLGLGQRVRVTGTTTEGFNLLMLSTDAAGITPLPFTSSQIVPTGKINESTEGYLLRVEGTITQAIFSDLPYGYKLYIDDGSGELQIFIHASLAFDPTTLSFLSQVGKKISVTGTSAQFADEYELTPRFLRDIRLIWRP
jgi:DNA/RNA endonuclease YhcR with UshA esterase domain